MPKKVKTESEGDIQAAFFQWLSIHEKRFPELQLFYSVPNGANKSIAARMKFKREGLKAGVPDVHLPLGERPSLERLEEIIESGMSPLRGLWIEFKSDKGKLSDVQFDWHVKLRLTGHRVAVCRSWTDAANIVIDYLNLPIKKFDTIEIVKRAVGK